MPATSGPRTSSRPYTAAERAVLPPAPSERAGRGFAALERSAPGRWQEIDWHRLGFTDHAQTPLGQLSLTMDDVGIVIQSEAEASGFAATDLLDASQLRVAWLSRLAEALIDTSRSKPPH